MKRIKTLENVNILFKGRQKVLNGFESNIFPMAKQTHRKGSPSNVASWLEILTSKQIIKKIPIALAQIKSVSTSKKLLNQVCQIIYSLY